MNTESGAIRAYLLNLLLSFAPSVILAFGYALLANENLVGALIFVVGGIFVLTAALSILGSIISWTMFALFHRKTRAEDLQVALLSQDFPTPEEHEASAEGYLARIIEDEDLPSKVRLSAKADLACFSTLRTFAMIQNLWQMTLVYEDALRLLRLHRIRSQK